MHENESAGQAPARLISFIIPCYASEGSVGLVIDEIREVVAQRPGFDYQVVAVNDCSPDNVLSVLRDIAARDPKVAVIDLAKNGGRHNALMCGCHYAAGDYIVFIDDDQQCPADRLWDLMDPLLNPDYGKDGRGTYDVAIARYRKKTQSRFKNFGSAVNDRVATWLLGKDPNLKFSNFSVMKKFVKDEVIKYTNPYPYLSGLMLRATRRVINVDMEERVRTIGVGHYSFRKSFALWMNSFTAFSVKPLRISTGIGILWAVLGVLMGLRTVIRRLLNPAIPLGYSSTMAVLLFSTGMIMFMLGLIGEYIGRIYISLNNSPQFVIRETLNLGDASCAPASGSSCRRDPAAETGFHKAPSAETGFPRDPAAEAGFHKAPSAETGFHKDPAAETGFPRDPAAETGFHRDPAAETGFHKDPSARKKLLVIGAGDFQLPLTERAAQTCDVVLAAPVIPPEFEPHLTSRLITDVRDEEKILDFARKERIDGVITDQTDIAVRSVAYVAEKMGLPGIGYETGLLFTDKSRMRARLRELGIPQLENRTVSSPEEAAAFYREFCSKGSGSSRVILKPLDTQGSRGVSVCASEEEILQKYDDAARWSSNHSVIIEQFATGREFVVESLVLDHEYRTLCIGDTLYFDIPDAFAAKSRIFPTTADDKLRRRVLDLDEKIIRGFGLRQGITHSEYIMEGDDVYLIETAARGGGVYISSDLIHLSSGLDTEQFLIDIALGRQKEMPAILPQQQYCGYMAFYLPVGRILRADGIRETQSLPFVHRNQLGKVRVGMENREGATDKTSRLAVIVSGATRAELMEHMAQVRSTLRIEVKAPDGSLHGPIWE